MLYSTQIVGYRVKSGAVGLKIETEWTSEIDDLNLTGTVQHAYIQKVKGRTRLFLIDSANDLVFVNIRDGKRDDDITVSLPPFNTLKSQSSRLVLSSSEKLLFHKITESTQSECQMPSAVVDLTFELHNPGTLYVLTEDRKVSRIDDKCGVSETV